MPSLPRLEADMEQKISSKSLTSTLVSTLFTPDAASLYQLTADGYINGSWARSGSAKASFGNGGMVNTRSKYVTCLHLYCDSFGSGSLLTGGGFDVSSTASGQSVQGSVKQWDLNTGENVATFMGGEGQVRAIGVPGVTRDWVISTIPPVPESDSDSESDSETKEESKELDLYADDATFGHQTDDVLEEMQLKAKQERRARKHPPAPNAHALTTFVSGGDDTVIRLWDVPKTKLTTTLTAANPIGNVACFGTCAGRTSLVVSGHHAVSGKSTADVMLWDVSGKLSIGRLEGAHSYEVASMAVTADGNTLYTAGGMDDPTMKEWDLRMRKKLKNVGFHKDRITSMGLIQTEKVTHLITASKDCTTQISTIRKTGVVKSKLVAEISDQDVGWGQALSCGLMRESTFAGGQRKKPKTDLMVVGTDRVLRTYDLGDFISLEASGGSDKILDSNTAGEDRDASTRVTGLEDNYHAKQSEFWDNFGDDSEHAKKASDQEIRAMERRKEDAEKKKKEEEKRNAVKTDKYGNEVGSIEFWVAKGCEPMRPKIGDLVVLIGDNEVNSNEEETKEGEGGAHIEHLRKERIERIEALPKEAKEGALAFGKYDLGIVLKDDKSGVPYEIFSGYSGRTSWAEVAWLELASKEHVEKALQANGISKDSLKKGESVLGKAREEAEREAKEKEDEEEDEEALNYYNDMMNGGGETAVTNSKGMVEGGGGHGGKMGWDGVEEEKGGDEKAGEREESFSLANFARPPKPPADESKTPEELRDEAAREQAVQDSLSMYRSKKKEKAGEKGKRVSRF